MPSPARVWKSVTPSYPRSMAVIDVTEQDFQEKVIEASKDHPVVVDYWADWCGPCKMLGPVLEKAAAEREGQVTLAKLDTDANQRIAAEHGIQGIPAVKAFKDGKVVAEFVGAQPPAAVAQFLDPLTGPTASERLIAELNGSGELPVVRQALEHGDQERAFELLLEAIAAAEGDERERLITLTVGLFGELGHEHPLTMRYRRRLAASLY